MVEPEIPDWRLYERLAATVVAENMMLGAEFNQTMNATLTGAISGAQRQVDLIIEANWEDGRSLRIVFDAKYHKRRLTLKDVEAFEGMIRDCRADHGILVCPLGWSTAAKQRAAGLITLKLLTLSEAEEQTEWAKFAECNGCLANECDPLQRGFVLWDGQRLLNHLGFWIVLFTGKCGVCRRFQVWCWDCGEVFSLASGETHLCWCDDRSWAVLEIDGKPDATGMRRPAKCLVLTVDGTDTILDRVSLA